MSNSKPLRLLDFPMLVHMRILPQLAPTDCLELALQSSKFRKIIQNSKKIQATSLEWMFRGKLYIKLKFGEDDEVEITPPTGISSTRKRKFNNPLKSSELRFERKKYSNNEDGDKRTLVPCQKICFNRTTPMHLLELVTTSLMECVDVENFSLRLQSYTHIELINCFVWNFTRNFHYIEFLCLWEVDCTKELDFLQNQVTANLMRLDFIRETSMYLCKVPLKQKSLVIDRLKSYPLESLLNMETQRLRLLWSDMNCSNLNRIIKHWIVGGLEKLEKLHLTNWYGNDSQSTKVLMDGIETVETRKPRPDLLLQRWSNSEPFKTTFDILRECDGKRATVAIDWREFIFEVWPMENGN